MGRREVTNRAGYRVVTRTTDPLDPWNANVNRVRLMLQYGSTKKDIADALIASGLSNEEAYLIYVAAKSLDDDYIDEIKRRR